jgi:hypothetical protein
MVPVAYSCSQSLVRLLRNRTMRSCYTSFVLVFDTNELVVQSRRAEEAQPSPTAVQVGDRVKVSMYGSKVVDAVITFWNRA